MRILNKEYSKKVYIGIFLILFVIGIVVTNDYGIHCDQQSELDILYSNVKEYNESLFFGNETIADFCAKYEEKVGREVPLISESIERDHGVAPYYLIVPLLLINQDNPLAVILIQHYYNFILFFISVVALFYLAKRISGSNNVGLLIALFLYVTPRFFAEGHYNNKDILSFAMFLITFACGYYFLEKQNKKSCFLFALSAALCANIKIIGILPFAIIIFLALVELIKENKDNRKKYLKKILLVILMFMAFFIFLTPAIWEGGPIAYAKYLLFNATNFSRWDNYLLFDGSVFRQSVTGLPKRYILTEYVITTPIFILISSFVGMILMALDLIKRPKDFILDKNKLLMFIVIAMQLCFLAYATLSGMILYNGWRHLYFTYTGTLMACIYLWKWVFESNYKIMKNLLVTISGICILVLMITGVKNHPYQYTYFNFLAGENVSERYEIDYWCVSTYNALLELRDETEEEELVITSLDVVTWDRLNETNKILPESQIDILIEEQKNGWANTEYILDNPMYSNIYYKDAYDFIRSEYDLVVDIKAYGNDVIRIYQKKE